ncbi:HD domain-containing phosphohydrolase [Azospirillum sp.]|uniref:HD domain-containing phosphohydrolase n=1 Tax=Azospirillum sp. TaxID=34012 RepID=UPI002D5C3802|nr:HD domain-containing phosphohydrolase [Azospirillum sp.]HYD68934.1 HD domain-containing phosphohydrolase [Azospirillum sp.]
MTCCSDTGRSDAVPGGLCLPGTAPSGTPTRIVIVDDSVSSLAALEALVRAIPGCAPLPFARSAEALAWCLRNDSDLILLDYHMPPPNGLEFIAAYRREAAHPDVPVVMVTTSGSRDVRLRALHLGATDFLTKPVDESEFLARIRNLLRLHQSHRILTTRSQWLAEEVARATCTLVQRERETILFLSRAAEHRDPETGDHLVRMAAYARIIAEGMGQPADFVELIHTAAPMHDVGKIGIPDHILLKTGRLTACEVAIMQQHTVYGHEILAGSSSPLLLLAAEIALSHHERFDGAGYPHGLRGGDIPLAGRITALADVFDALTSVRPYKEAWPVERARAYVLAESGAHFDPACVEAFRARWPEIREVAARYSANAAPVPVRAPVHS